MADDRYSWLDKNAAEGLLRGERVDAGGGFGADELNDLLSAAAVAGARSSADAPLPGEEAAVAAFRQVSSGGSTRDTAAGGAARASAEDGIPVVRSVPGGGTSRTAERTRLGRPLRRGLAVALAGCALGGVAVAAGTGVLPTPFHGGGDPSPSVTSAVTPSILESQDPEADASDDAAQSPDAGPHSSSPASPTSPDASDGRSTPGREGTGDTSKPPLPQLTPGDGALNTDKAKRKAAVLALCRDYEAGRTSPKDRQRLERTMGGAEKLHTFCKQYLQKNGLTGGLGSSDPTPDSGLTGGSNDGDATGGTSTGGNDSDNQESTDGNKTTDDESHPAVSPSTTTQSPQPSPTPSTPTTSPTATPN
ncbi:hypothetical protein [Streptomyces ochraceiscleroticus]|uniref:Extensin n=1 Tax=Streptomyces ochraceiscleroticus TaxID=47761 RepID=A0ABW1MH05_9ACTN|nr:hypothetical protein [Streptomyces ochraceiscleroticus]